MDIERKAPLASVEIIIEKDGKIVLIKREGPPFKGKWKLPGGMVEYGQTVEQAAVLEAKEETNLDVELLDILGVYSNPQRDPRFHSLATVFVAKPLNGELKGDIVETTDAKWIDIKYLTTDDMGFDHGKILEDFKKWLSGKKTFWTGR
ncbi:MAG: NUDIX hydrolase [Candidatus Aenigmarchaeota archaeon]|nr:NUDIX hydrolase [Candidatus Aenigmarchaeota archaeon]